ncbi:MAG: filament integrity protein FraC [Spirulina sp.]
MPTAILPLPLIILQTFTLFVSIALEAIVLQQKLRLTRKQSIEFSISINLLSTIILWFVFFLFEVLAPNSENLHLIGIIFFNNFSDLDRWTEVYPILAVVITMMFALIVFVEFRALQLLQALLQIFSDQNTQQQSAPSFEQINTIITQSDTSTIYTVFQANILSLTVVVLLIILLNLY